MSLAGRSRRFPSLERRRVGCLEEPTRELHSFVGSGRQAGENSAHARPGQPQRLGRGVDQAALGLPERHHCRADLEGHNDPALGERFGDVAGPGRVPDLPPTLRRSWSRRPATMHPAAFLAGQWDRPARRSRARPCPTSPFRPVCRGRPHALGHNGLARPACPDVSENPMRFARPPLSAPAAGRNPMQVQLRFFVIFVALQTGAGRRVHLAAPGSRC